MKIPRLNIKEGIDLVFKEPSGHTYLIRTEKR